MTDTSNDTLVAALARHRIEPPPEKLDALAAYARLLWEWNEKLNLTRHTDWERFVGRDVRDSMALSEHLAPGQRVLDVGTGGGVPGVVLKIVRDDLHVELCESVGKKARAVADIVERLRLPVRVHHARAEDVLGRLRGRERVDALLVRAVARLAKLLRWLEPHWRRFDRLLLIKGPGWVEERGEARHLGLMHGLTLRRLASYPLPGTDSESVVLMIRRTE